MDKEVKNGCCNICNSLSIEFYGRPCELNSTCDCHFIKDENGKTIMRKRGKLYFVEEDWKKLKI